MQRDDQGAICFLQSLCKFCLRGLLQHSHKHQCHYQIISILSQPLLNGSMTATLNQKKCMSTDICYLLSGLLWTNISYVGSAEKTGPPIAVWLGARASTNPCLRADTPEFSWPDTEPAQQQGGGQTMFGHWSIALTGTLEDRPIPVWDTEKPVIRGECVYERFTTGTKIFTGTVWVRTSRAE